MTHLDLVDLRRPDLGKLLQLIDVSNAKVAGSNSLCFAFVV